MVKEGKKRKAEAAEELAVDSSPASPRRAGNDHDVGRNTPQPPVASATASRQDGDRSKQQQHQQHQRYDQQEQEEQPTTTTTATTATTTASPAVDSVKRKKKRKKKKRRREDDGLKEGKNGTAPGGTRDSKSDTAVTAPAAQSVAAAVAAGFGVDRSARGADAAESASSLAPTSADVAAAAPAVTQTTAGAMSRTNQSDDHSRGKSPGAVEGSSPPPQRRRLGKTHGRARKAGVGGGAGQPGPAGDGGHGAGTRDSHPTPLTPGGPGQGKPRKHTLSIAIPGSVVDNAQNRELKTYLVGEIARAAAIFEVDEIVVYDDLSASRKGQGGVRDDSATVNFNARGGDGGGGRGDGMGYGAGGGGRGRGGDGGRSGGVGVGGGGGGGDRNNPNVFMARLLQYVETPQYLRKKLFPMHSSLRLAGLLNPLDAPHHMRADDECPFREGVVLDKAVKKGAGSFVDIGKRKEARIDRPLEAGVRVTVKLDKGDLCKKNHKGRAVPPSAPREELGLYWGYQTRLASGMADVLAGCPYKGGYDLTVGTSERGSVTVDSPEFALPKYRHLLVVFGGVQGIEATVDADETLQLPGSESSALFDLWVNTCPGQGSRTIRTEEAVLITLARLRQYVLVNGAQAAPPSSSPPPSPSGGGGDSGGVVSDGVGAADSGDTVGFRQEE